MPALFWGPSAALIPGLMKPRHARCTIEPMSASVRVLGNDFIDLTRGPVGGKPEDVLGFLGGLFGSGLRSGCSWAARENPARVVCRVCCFSGQGRGGSRWLNKPPGQARPGSCESDKRLSGITAGSWQRVVVKGIMSNLFGAPYLAGKCVETTNAMSQEIGRYYVPKPPARGLGTTPASHEQELLARKFTSKIWPLKEGGGLKSEIFPHIKMGDQICSESAQNLTSSDQF
ncbi:hypothetical protein BYT27DRAFT_7216812 [Phlegmacium glaucopus]|nr:hypothetical protein BYT27DRAFT_7216812 [Phlegmacium glaucopus]